MPPKRFDYNKPMFGVREFPGATPTPSSQPNAAPAAPAPERPSPISNLGRAANFGLAYGEPLFGVKEFARDDPPAEAKTGLQEKRDEALQRRQELLQDAVSSHAQRAEKVADTHHMMLGNWRNRAQPREEEFVQAMEHSTTAVTWDFRETYALVNGIFRNTRD